MPSMITGLTDALEIIRNLIIIDGDTSFTSVGGWRVCVCVWGGGGGGEFEIKKPPRCPAAMRDNSLNS